MADVIGLAARIEERCKRLDQVDQALAKMRQLLQQQRREAIAPRKQKRPRQLWLPLTEGKRLRRSA